MFSYFKGIFIGFIRSLFPYAIIVAIIIWIINLISSLSDSDKDEWLGIFFFYLLALIALLIGAFAISALFSGILTIGLVAIIIFIILWVIMTN